MVMLMAAASRLTRRSRARPPRRTGNGSIHVRNPKEAYLGGAVRAQPDVVRDLRRHLSDVFPRRLRKFLDFVHPMISKLRIVEFSVRVMNANRKVLERVKFVINFWAGGSFFLGRAQERSKERSTEKVTHVSSERDSVCVVRTAFLAIHLDSGSPHTSTTTLAHL